ncbi:MAG: type IV pilin protein [Rubrivivax sp.]|nr:type IV pilin protein [Rubrivivax sp.]MDH5340050.1 type IV pilin protein [Rubrivivax sp.]
MARRWRGFTLVELLIGVALAALLATFAWPMMQGQLTQARRADATAALHVVQLAQERHLAQYGLYAQNLVELGRPDRSPEGLYRIELQPAGADTYLAVARPAPGGPQAADRGCAEITLRVAQGFAQPGPSAACWAR